MVAQFGVHPHMRTTELNKNDPYPPQLTVLAVGRFNFQLNYLLKKKKDRLV